MGFCYEQKGSKVGRRGMKQIEVFMFCVIIIATSFRSSNGCPFPGIYNFGDSNSDTGTVSAIFHRLPLPNGETFFGKRSGRYSDGRLTIDFIAEKLRLPFLRPYVDAIAPNFMHGANFAAAGATIQYANATIIGAGFNPLSLGIQLMQFQQFKERTTELYDQDKSLWIQGNLPRPEDFSKALYTLDIGQNDLHFGLKTTNVEQTLQSIPYILDQFVSSVEMLYHKGARMFWIHNTGPIGCLPYFVINFPPKPSDADRIGCVRSYNEMAQEFNEQLKERVYKLGTRLHGAVLILVDIYTAKYSLISEAEKHGFVDPLGSCCGNQGFCQGTPCNDPSEYISWDGVHYTEAGNHWVANHIFDGLLSDPPIPLTRACQDPHSCSPTMDTF